MRVIQEICREGGHPMGGLFDAADKLPAAFIQLRGMILQKSAAVLRHRPERRPKIVGDGGAEMFQLAIQCIDPNHLLPEFFGPLPEIEEYLDLGAQKNG